MACVQKAVYDVSWSPHSSTLFACVTEQTVVVYDLRQNAYALTLTLSRTSSPIEHLARTHMHVQ